MVSRFLDFELDEARFELRRNNRVVPAQARVFRLIAHLLRHRARVVSKRELIETVWEGTLVSEAAINQVVMLARKALDDDGQRVIRTIRGQGFRFVADVRSDVAPARVERPVAIEQAASTRLRERELALLGEYVDRAARGQGALVLIEGEPGIGKTWLLDELAARVKDAGSVVLCGRSCSGAGAPPLWPWIETVRQSFDALGEAEAVRDIVGPSFDAMFALLPELAPHDHVRSLSPQGPGDDGHDVGNDARFRSYDAIVRYLRLLSGRRPPPALEIGAPYRVVLLDDLHTFDDASLQLLRMLGPRLSDLRLLVVGTYCELRLPDSPALATIVSELPDGARHVRLAGFDEMELKVMLEALTGTSPTPGWVSLVHQLSLGNPMLARDLGLTGRNEDATASAVRSSFSPPEKMVSAVQGVLHALTPSTRDLLAVAALMGREFAVSELACLLGQSERALLEVLTSANVQRVVEPSPARPDHFQFDQAAVQSVLYHGLSSVRRAALHRQVGELLEAEVPLPLRALARHFALADGATSRAKAARYTHAAADEAYEASAFELAATLYDRALELAEAERVARTQLHAFAMRAGAAWDRAGEYEAACRRFERAERFADADSIERVWAVARAVHVQRAKLLFDDSIQQRLRDAYERVCIETNDVGAMISSLQAIASRPYELDQRDERSRRAVEIARACGNREVLDWALLARHFALLGVAYPRELAELASELVERARADGNRELLLDCLLHHMVDSLMAGDLPSVMRDRSEHRALVEESSTPFHRYMSTACDAAEATMAGSFESGMRWSVRAAELGARLDPGAILNHRVRTLFSHVYYGVGDGAIADCGFDEVRPEYRVFWCLSWIRGDRVEDVRRTLSATEAAGLHQPIAPVLRRPNWAVLGELSAELGELALAREVYGLLEPAAGTHLALHAGVYIGPVSYYLALISAADHQPARAQQHFEAAFREAMSVAALPFVARMRSRYATWLSTQPGCEQRAEDERLAATRLARGLGMKLA